MKRLPAFLLAFLTVATLAVVGWGLLAGSAGPGAGGGTAGLRTVDMDRYLRRVQEGSLSNQEARWWVPVAP
jgi:hypothetical protein